MISMKNSPHTVQHQLAQQWRQFAASEVFDSFGQRLLRVVQIDRDAVLANLRRVSVGHGSTSRQKVEGENAPARESARDRAGRTLEAAPGRRDRRSGGGKSLTCGPVVRLLLANRQDGLRCGTRDGLGIDVRVDLMASNAAQSFQFDDVLGWHTGFVDPVLDCLEGHGEVLGAGFFTAGKLNSPLDIGASGFDGHASW
jgi:hypothetical protein